MTLSIHAAQTAPSLAHLATTLAGSGVFLAALFYDALTAHPHEQKVPSWFHLGKTSVQVLNFFLGAV